MGIHTCAQTVHTISCHAQSEEGNDGNGASKTGASKQRLRKDISHQSCHAQSEEGNHGNGASETGASKQRTHKNISHHSCHAQSGEVSEGNKSVSEQEGGGDGNGVSQQQTLVAAAVAALQQQKQHTLAVLDALEGMLLHGGDAGEAKECEVQIECFS
jgi:hypothetical protein